MLLRWQGDFFTEQLFCFIPEIFSRLHNTVCIGYLNNLQPADAHDPNNLSHFKKANFTQDENKHSDGKLQCPPLNRITLGQLKSDNNNRQIQLTDVFCVLLYVRVQWDQRYLITISG